MVLELLTGGSLRGMLDADGRLSPSQAAHVGRQVTSALEYAHRARRRPPRHQARQPAVRRARDRARRRLRSRPCPRGGELDRARRHGRGHRAVRGARAGDRRPARRSRRPLLARGRAGRGGHRHRARGRRHRHRHAGRAHAHRRSSRRLALGRLGPVVERAGRPDPAERYPDAATMRAALADAARALPPPQPLTLAGLGGEIDGGPPTQIGRSSKLFDQDEPVAPPVVVDEPVRPITTRRRRAPGAVRWITYAVIIAILLAILGGGIAIAAVSSGGGTVAVPSLVGLTQEKATDEVVGHRALVDDRPPQRRRPRRHRDRPVARTGRVRERRRFGRARRVPRSASGRHHRRCRVDRPPTRRPRSRPRASW